MTMTLKKYLTNGLNTFMGDNTEETVFYSFKKDKYKFIKQVIDMDKNYRLPETMETTQGI